MAHRKPRQLSRGEHRRLRTRQILFSILAILVIASFVISLLTTF
jgi:uncharacterized membrane protein